MISQETTGCLEEVQQLCELNFGTLERKAHLDPLGLEVAEVVGVFGLAAYGTDILVTDYPRLITSVG